MTRLLLLATLLLSACVGPFAKQRLGTPFKFGDKGDLLDFSYGWPAEASAIPALEKQFRADLDKEWRKALAVALADRASAARAKRRFNGHQLAVDWSTAGQSRRLLSLEGRTSAFTGGAHPNHGSSAVLWDRRAGTRIAAAELLQNSGRLSALIGSSFCASLDRERTKRRQQPTPASAQFGACPKLSEVTIVPADRNANRRFDHLRITADPYVAGPYAEGFYQLELPLTAAFLGALKPAYRSSFEVSRNK